MKTSPISCWNFGLASVILTLTLLLPSPASAACGLGTALQFDGSDDRVLISGFGNSMPATELTIEFWMYLADNSPRSVFVLNPDVPGNRITFEVDPSSNSAFWEFGNADANSRLAVAYGNGFLVPGNWFHVVLVASSQNGGFMRADVNGLSGSQGGEPSFVPGNYDLVLGGTNLSVSGTDYSPFNGVLEEFRVWNIIRSPADSLPGSLCAPLSGHEPGLVAYWHFDEGTGANTTNATTNGVWTATLVNGTLWVSSTAPPGVGVFTESATGVTQTNATVNGYVFSPQTTTQVTFEWGTATNYGYSISAFNSPVGFDCQSVSNLITGLSPNALYHYRCVGTFTLNNVVFVYGPDRTFTTSNGTAPTAVTDAPSFPYAATSATLNGTVNPNGLATTAYFQWGFTTNYGNGTPSTNVGSGNNPIDIAAGVTNLTPHTLYHFRLAGTNALGLAVGDDQTFTTARSNTSLVTLTSSSGTLTPAFNSNVTSYTASVPNSVLSVTVTPTTAEDSVASVQVRVNGGAYDFVLSGQASGPLPLSVGNNAIELRVSAQDPAFKRTYTLTVNRQPIPPSAIPLPASRNIGGNKVGSVTNNGGGSYTIVGGGNDIWDERDEFTYAYIEVTGDFDVQVQVQSLQFNAAGSKAGIMVRETLSEFSRMAFVRVTPNGGSNDTRFAYRTGLDASAGVNGGKHEDCTDCGNQRPGNGHTWLRLVHTGSVLTASSSTNGNTWVVLGTQDTATWGGGALAATLFVGLGVSRHSGGPTATAEFRNFQFNYNAPFAVMRASSRGNPNGVRVEFNEPVGVGAMNPANYTSPELSVSAVAAGPTPTSVQLTTSNLSEGNLYHLVVTNVQAADASALTSGTASFVHGAGYEVRFIGISHNKTSDSGYYQFSDAVRNGIGDVVHNGALGGVYPPVQINNLFEDIIPDNGDNERFSSRISGVLNITTSGNYTFYMSSDDVGYLYLSTDANPANKVQIASEPQWNGSRQYTNLDRRNGAAPENRTGPIALLAGSKYYLETIYSEFGGGNNCSVTWQPPGAPPVVNGSTPIPDSAFAPSRWFDGNTFTTLGPVQIVAQPTNRTVTGLSPVTFQVGLDGTPGYTYQWLRNGQPIAGATDPTYTIQVPQPDDYQAVFSVLAGNEFSSTTSSNAVLIPALSVRLLPLGSPPDGGKVHISWPAAATNYQLQENPTLGPNNWSLSSIVPQIAGNQKYVLVAPTNSSRFYRLQRP